MSADDSGGGPGMREVAWRVFAAEFDDATYSYSEGDRERAPNYVVTPTGGRVNRLFVVGVLTAVEPVSDEVLRARVVDPTGAFVVYAGQYQPEPLAFLERVEPPAFVAVTGKARTFQPDDSDVVYTSIRPESVNEVDAEARDRWVVSTAGQTLHRVSAFADAIDRPERGTDLETVLSNAGLDDGLAGGIPRAIEQYGTTTAYLAAVRDLSLDAARVVAGDVEEAEPLALAPDEGGDVALDLSFSVDLDEAAPEAAASTPGASGDVPADADAIADEEATASGPAETGADDTAGTEPAPADEATGDVAAGDATEDQPAPVESASVDGGEDEEMAVEPDEETVVELDEPTDAATTEPAADEAEAGVEDATGPADDAEAVGMYELDDEERAELEEEFPTEFSSGSDIPDAGEAGIETPSPAEEEPATGDEETADADEVVEADETDEDDGTGDDDAAVEAEEADEDDEAGDDDAASEADVPDDLEDVVVEYMQELDDGDGADREELVAAVTADYAVGDGDVEEAVQDALMSGRCFEPADGRIKAI